MDLKPLSTFGKSHSHGESARNAGDLGQEGSYWRRKWQPTQVFLPGKFHGQRSLAGYGHEIAKSRARLSDFTGSLTTKWNKRARKRVAVGAGREEPFR